MQKLTKTKGTPGLYRHISSGVYYERVAIKDENTYLSLHLTNGLTAKTLVGLRRAARATGKPIPIGIDGEGNPIYENGAIAQPTAPAQAATPVQPAAPAQPANGSPATALPAGQEDKKKDEKPKVVFCAQLFKRYEEDHYPNKKGNPKWHTEEQRKKHPETLFLANLRLFFESVPYAELCQDKYDQYKEKRVKEVKAGSDGLRMVDRELQCFYAVCKWAKRKNLVQYNALADRIGFYDKKTAKKAKDRTPEDLEELHKIAGDMMSLGTSEAEACGFQYLIEGYTSLRTTEAISLKFKPHQSEAGARTADGKSFRVHHVKLTAFQNHFARVTKGLAMLLDAIEDWHEKRFPKGHPFMFPGHRQNSHIHRTSLTHLLQEFWELPKEDPRHTRIWFSSHGARALFVWVCRRMGIRDEQIAWSINHTGGMKAFYESYSRAPEHWFNGEAPLPADYDWVPKCPPAWTRIKYKDANGKKTGGHKRVS
jgi:hypothetical protein